MIIIDSSDRFLPAFFLSGPPGSAPSSFGLLHPRAPIGKEENP
jgi:hypothetical protein